MRYDLQLDELEPVYHARTAVTLMLQELSVDDAVTHKSTSAVRTAYRQLPATSQVTELQNLMASLAHTQPAVINASAEVRTSVVSRCTSILEEIRSILE